MGKAEDRDEETPRLDKWLWAARFFKTRGLAQQAINGGKVEVNGDKPKPSRHLRVGDVLSIRRGAQEFVVTVIGLSMQRGPAAVASALYEETAESIAKRQALADERRLLAAAQPQFAGRPSKRDRRRIVRFTRRNEG